MSDLATTIEEANVREFKLTNGQTIISELMGIHEDKFVLYDPYIIDASQSTGIVIFRKWFVGAEDDLQYLSENHVMSHATCRHDVKEAYMRNALEEKAIEHMEDDPDNYEFYTDTPDTSDIVH